MCFLLIIKWIMKNNTAEETGAHVRIQLVLKAASESNGKERRV